MSAATIAARVAKLLQLKGCKLAFAESCTGGLVSGALTAIPGISAHHCGGVVVYRNETKTAYLGIAPRLLKQYGAVSEQVAERMAQGILDKTPEANLGVSVTGHLGPQAPPEQDGHVYVSLAWRQGSSRRERRPQTHLLKCREADSRVARQRWVVEQVLKLVAEALAAVERK